MNLWNYVKSWDVFSSLSVKESGFILLQTVPSHIKLEDIQRKIEEVSGAIHLWTDDMCTCNNCKKKKKKFKPTRKA